MPAPGPRRGPRAPRRRRGADPPARPEDVLPVLPLHSAVVLPGEHATVRVGRPGSLAALRRAQAADGRLLLVPQRDPECEQPGPGDLRDMATVGRIAHVDPDPEGLRVTVQGLGRALWRPLPPPGPAEAPGARAAGPGEAPPPVGGPGEGAGAAVGRPAPAPSPPATAPPPGGGEDGIARSVAGAPRARRRGVGPGPRPDGHGTGAAPGMSTAGEPSPPVVPPAGLDAVVLPAAPGGAEDVAGAGLADAAAWLWLQVRVLPELRGADSPASAGLPATEQPGAFADALGARLCQGRAERLALLECAGAAERLPLLQRLLLPRLPRPAADPEVARATVRRMQEEQRRYVLREQLRAIQRELGEEAEGEAERWRARLRDAGLPPAALQAGMMEAARLERMAASSSEAAIARTYLEWLADLPWRRLVPERDDLEAARRLLDAEHSGLDAVKERILEHLAVHLLWQRARGRSADPADAGGPPPPPGPPAPGPAPPAGAAGGALCLAGPPGTGKTSLARSMADALGRPFGRVALGGVRDEAEIRGHRRTYVGALPGRILAAMRRAACRNPLLLLDEIDKLGRDGHGDPAAALLEVLDPEQQGAFSDHYLEVPFDLSQVMWVATANDLGAMPAPLRDRLEVVVLPPYGAEEKAAIAARHLIPRQAALHALPPGALSLTDAAVRALVRRQGAEPGLRGLERQVAALCRKAARLVLTDPGARLHVTGSNLDGLLDPGPGDPGPPA